MNKPAILHVTPTSKLSLTTGQLTISLFGSVYSRRSVVGLKLVWQKAKPEAHEVLGVNLRVRLIATATQIEKAEVYLPIPIKHEEIVIEDIFGRKLFEVLDADGDYLIRIETGSGENESVKAFCELPFQYITILDE